MEIGRLGDWWAAFALGELGAVGLWGSDRNQAEIPARGHHQ